MADSEVGATVRLESRPESPRATGTGRSLVYVPPQKRRVRNGKAKVGNVPQPTGSPSGSPELESQTDRPLGRPESDGYSDKGARSRFVWRYLVKENSPAARYFANSVDVSDSDDSQAQASILPAAVFLIVDRLNKKHDGYVRRVVVSGLTVPIDPEPKTNFKALRKRPDCQPYSLGFVTGDIPNISDLDWVVLIRTPGVVGQIEGTFAWIRDGPQVMLANELQRLVYVKYDHAFLERAFEHDGDVWHFDFNMGEFWVFRKEPLKPAPTFEPLMTYCDGYEIVRAPVAYSYTWFLPDFVRRYLTGRYGKICLADNHLRCALGTFMLAHARSTWNYRGVAAVLIREIDKMPLARSYLPDRIARLQEEQLLVLYGAEARELAEATNDHLGDVSKPHDVLNNAMKGVFDIMKLPISSLGMGLVGLLLVFRFRRAISGVLKLTDTLFDIGLNRVPTGLTRVSRFVVGLLPGVPASLLPFGRLTPWAEEVLKRIPGFGYPFACLDALIARDWRLIPFHVATGWFPFPVAVGAHYAFNYCVRRSRSVVQAAAPAVTGLGHFAQRWVQKLPAFIGGERLKAIAAVVTHSRLATYVDIVISKSAAFCAGHFPGAHRFSFVQRWVQKLPSFVGGDRVKALVAAATHSRLATCADAVIAKSAAFCASHGISSGAYKFGAMTRMHADASVRWIQQVVKPLCKVAVKSVASCVPGAQEVSILAQTHVAATRWIQQAIKPFSGVPAGALARACRWLPSVPVDPPRTLGNLFKSLVPRCPGSLLPCGPFTPLVEEVLKRVPGVVLPLACCDAIMSHDWRLIPFHIVMRCLPLPLAICAHYSFNYSVLRFAAWNTVREHYYLQAWERRSIIDDVACEPIQPAMAMVPRQEFPHYTPVERCPHMTYIDRGRFFEVPPVSVHHVLATNVPSFAVANSYDMIRAAIDARVLKRPPLAPMTQAIRWRKVDWYRIVPQHDPIDNEAAYPDWIDHFDDKHKCKRYATVHAALVAGETFTPTCVQTFIKSDEILLKPDFDLKPRLIANVPPAVQVLVGPSIRVATKRLKEIFDGTILDCGIRVAFGAGMTDAQLSRWMRDTLSTPDVPSLIAAGDDSVFYDGSDWFCCDASSYDQSQSFGCLENGYKFYLRLGVSAEAIDLLRMVSRLPYLHRTKNGSIVVKRRQRPIRDTGGPDTTLGNTVNMLSAWLYAYEKKDYEAAFTYLGFKMKFHKLPLLRVNFLKGSWVKGWLDGESCPIWHPLPSRILKVGICKGPLTQLYSGDYVECALRHLAGVVGSMRTAAFVPCLRVLISRFDTGIEGGHYEGQVTLVQDARVAAEDILEHYATYYGCCVFDLLEVEKLLLCVPIPGYVAHPLLLRMAEVDYA